MLEQDFNLIFSRNLNNYLEENHKTQAELAQYVGASTSAVSAWCRGQKTPRMDKIDKMCEFFGIKRSDLMEDHDANQKEYYFDKETADIAQKLYENKDLRMLFDAASDSEPEDLKALHSMILALKRKERGYKDGEY